MSTPSAPTAETNAANVATPTAVATVPPSTLITIKLPANKKDDTNNLFNNLRNSSWSHRLVTLEITTN